MAAHSERVFGYTLVRINGMRLELEAKTVDGRVIDTLVIDKRDPAADRRYLDSAITLESIKDPTEAIDLAELAETLAEDAEDKQGAEAENLVVKALELYRRAFELDPTFAEALAEMGKLNRDQRPGQTPRGDALSCVIADNKIGYVVAERAGFDFISIGNSFAFVTLLFAAGAIAYSGF